MSMKRSTKPKAKKQRLVLGTAIDRRVLRATPTQLFAVFQQAWNLRECVRLLTPGKSVRQFKGSIDREWIADINAHLTQIFRAVGLNLADARSMFAPDDCPDLVVAHVVLETEATPDLHHLGDQLRALADQDATFGDALAVLAGRFDSMSVDHAVAYVNANRNMYGKR